MFQRSIRFPLALVVLLAGFALPLAAQASSAPQLRTSSGDLFFTGDAYGTFAFVGKTVRAGRTAVVGLGCTTSAGVHNSNTVATANLPNIGSTGVINTTADTSDNGTTVKSRTTASVHNVNLLSGLITASEVTASSTTSHNATGFTVSAAGSSFVNLVVNGVPITVAPAPNTTIGLPGVGSVVLNEQISRIRAASAELTVNMMHVYVTAKLPGIAKGTEIIVAHAKSDLELNKAGSLDGFAYGTQAKVGNVLILGKSALVRMGCGGTKGKLKTNEVASVNIPGVGSTGTVIDTAQGTIDATSAIGETTSSVETVNLLSGLIQADHVKADAHASKVNGVFTFSDAGSSFLNLVVDGQPISGDVAENTKITFVEGMTIWLHRVIRKPNSIEVRMIEIIVTGPNAFNLELDTNIQVAVAHASVH